MYEAEDDKVYYVHPITGIRELFLTVHPTKASVPIPQQARVLADMINDWSSVGGVK